MTAQYNVDHSVVKKPGNDLPLTPEQEEMWMRYADDPMAFFTEQCYVRGSKGKVLFQPRIYQEELLDSVIDNTHVIAVSPRQSGKCCVSDTSVTIRINGKIREMTIGDLHSNIRRNNIDFNEYDIVRQIKGESK